MVEWARLESECALTGTKGSNPFLSALNPRAEMGRAGAQKKIDTHPYTYVAGGTVFFRTMEIITN